MVCIYVWCGVMCVYACLVDRDDVAEAKHCSFSANINELLKIWII